MYRLKWLYEKRRHGIELGKEQNQKNKKKEMIEQELLKTEHKYITETKSKFLFEKTII